MAATSRRLRVLTWHVHGNYLWYLSHAPHDFFLPVGADGRGGRGHSFPFGPNVHDVAAEAVRDQQFDCILFQHHDNWLVDQQQFGVLRQQHTDLQPLFLAVREAAGLILG